MEKCCANILEDSILKFRFFKKLTSRFNVIQDKIPTRCVVEVDKLMLKLKWECERQNSQNNQEKRIVLENSFFQDVVYNYSN